MKDTYLTVELYQKADELAFTARQREALDLLKCIQTYRACPSIALLLRNKPKLVHQLDDIYRLWKKFEKLSQEELADLAMQLVKEIGAGY